MGEQYEMNFEARRPVPHEMPKDPNADIETMDAVQLQELIESLNQTILSSKTGDRDFAVELEERRDRAEKKLKSLQI